MTDAQLKDTKDRILTAARKLFAVKGYDGASVREIAKEAGVNIAALNYHFHGKENLFYQVLELAFDEASAAIRSHRQTHPNETVEDFAIFIFNHWLSHADMLRSMFKMMLSEEGWGEEADCGGEEEPYGPPGGKALAEAIQMQLKKAIPEEDMYWAVKMIFGNVTHLSLLYSNHFCRLTEEEAPYHDKPTLERDLRRLVRVVLGELAAHDGSGKNSSK